MLGFGVSLRKMSIMNGSLMFKEANSTLGGNREWRVAEVCQRLEHDLEILGVAAIEDRLQDKGIPFDFLMISYYFTSIKLFAYQDAVPETN
nr:phospholipid-transporting ATPase 2 isoform X1 [Ipomoea batatas]